MQLGEPSATTVYYYSTESTDTIMAFIREIAPLATHIEYLSASAQLIFTIAGQIFRFADGDILEIISGVPCVFADN